MRKFLIRYERDILNDGVNATSEVEHLDSRLIVQWSYDIANGMQYLSRKHIMHGDLAARNILISGRIYILF